MDHPAKLHELGGIQEGAEGRRREVRESLPFVLREALGVERYGRLRAGL
jgi:hypothetical protein